VADTPPFILEQFQTLKNDKKLMDSLDGFSTYEISYNTKKYINGDTLPYTIEIVGKVDNLRLIYNGVYARNSKGNWEIQRDTIFFQSKP
jgi:hypothetical protein